MVIKNICLIKHVDLASVLVKTGMLGFQCETSISIQQRQLTCETCRTECVYDLIGLC